MVDGRGQLQVERKKLLTKKIRKFISENKNLNRKEVGEAVGVSQKTLRIHLKIISESSE